jgi:putative membrane protein
VILGALPITVYTPISVLRWLLPWDFSPTVLVTCTAAVVLFVRGGRCDAATHVTSPRWRRAAFYSGVALFYLPLQTRYDYLAQHMFWMHRLQHLMLHDVGSFLFALAAPWRQLAAGVPAAWRPALRRILLAGPVRRIYDVLQRPVIAFGFFVGLIYFWLWPSIHFRAMLSLDEYKCMNWSVALDGLLFWSLILDPRAHDEGAPMSLGARILMVLLVMVPETIIGAYLTLNQHIVYNVYAVCGRLWPIDPVVDQQIGGLIIWIPASMMCSFAALVVLRRWIHHDVRTQAARTSLGIAGRSMAQETS